jgi:hypothetical protein
MSDAPKEITEVHIRLLKCMLEPENSRAYWAHADGSTPVDVQRAFAEYWFGARSLPRVQMLLANFRVRFGAFPAALGVLHRWADMPPDTRRLICHWHAQLADPLYREFSGCYLPERRDGHRAEVTLDLAVNWVKQHGQPQWQMATRIKFASNLLSTARAAGIVTGNRDPRPVASPRVDDDALEYLFYLLRGVQFAGTLLDNPYLRSVGLTGGLLEDRLRRLRSLRLRRQGNLADFEWQYSDLGQWAEGTGKARGGAVSGGGQ